MLYFSYNDFVDCTENGKIDEVIKVEEKILRYEIKNGRRIVDNSKNKIIEILKEKKEMKCFLKEFFDLSGMGAIEKISYYNNIKSISNEQKNCNIIWKIKDKEIFIFIKVIENIDNNIAYKMFEHAMHIIEKWNRQEKIEKRRYPIVIPIVIYTGKESWKNSNSRKYNKINYTTYQDIKINFSYNMININNLKICELKKMQSKISKELMSIKITNLP